MDSKERNERNDKKELKNYVFQFRMNMWQIRTDMQNETERILAATQKEKVKTNFVWSCENFAQSCKMLQEGENVADAISTLHNHAKLHFFSRFLGKEAFGRPLRLCQVPTWPWSINRNLIYSFEDFLHFSHCRTFQIFSL